jgi:hypothetical protein
MDGGAQILTPWISRELDGQQGMEVSGHCLASAYVPDYLAAGAGQAYPVTSHRSLARERDSHNHMRLCTCEEEYM